MILLGSDGSHWNPLETEMGQFQIHKLSQGVSFTDPQVMAWWGLRKGELNGVYHYLTTQDAVLQCEHIVSCIKKFRMEHGVLFALDVEGDYLNQYDWCGELVNFVDTLTAYMEFQPVIYLDKTALKQLVIWAISNGADLASQWAFWIADYESTSIDHKYFDFTFPVLRQYTATPYDLDMFFGSPESWSVFAQATKIL